MSPPERTRSGPRRIFVALPFSKAFQDVVAVWRQKFGMPVRWLQGRNLHVTIAPPWQEDDVESLKMKAGKVKHRPFELEFERVTYGPDQRAPRLIWAEGNASAEVMGMRDEIFEAIGQPKPRSFTLHATLARFRPEAFPSFAIQRLDERVEWKEIIHSFVLMESHLSPQGADYEIVAEFPLS